VWGVADIGWRLMGIAKVIARWAWDLWAWDAVGLKARLKATAVATKSPCGD